MQSALPKRAGYPPAWEVVDLLPDRTAETAAAWPQQYVGVEIVTRDRSADYARAISTGALQALQVADRFHLVKNVGEVLERIVQRNQQGLRLAAKAIDQEHARQTASAIDEMHAFVQPFSTPQRPVPQPQPTTERSVQGAPAR